MSFKHFALLGVSAFSLVACQAPPSETATKQESVSTSDTAAPPEMTVAEIHDSTLTLDTHIDIPLTYMSEIDPSGPTDLQVDLPKLVSGKLDSGFWIVYTPQGDLTAEGYADALKIAETRVKAINQMSSTYTDTVEPAKTAADVRRIVGEGKHAVIIGMENAYPLGESVEAVPLWAERGVRYMGLTHFGHNQFGDSSNPNPERDTGPKWDGLSPLGKELVQALNANGIMVDVSHTGKATMMQAADVSATPIIASHSGVKAIADTERNLDDEQLRKIRDVNGVAQMVALGSYVKLKSEEQAAAEKVVEEKYKLSGLADYNLLDEDTKAAFDAEYTVAKAIGEPATVVDFVNHIDHAVKVAGIDHVGIASDFDGGGGIVGWKDASETENVTAELVSRGYTQEDIAKIWGGNLLRVMEAVEAGASN